MEGCREMDEIQRILKEKREPRIERIYGFGRGFNRGLLSFLFGEYNSIRDLTKIMKLALFTSIYLSMACSLPAKSDGDLSIYGTISEVKTIEGKVSIKLTGIASLALNDPSLKNQLQVFSLSDVEIFLKFDSEIKGMHTYSRFRYLDWIDESKAIAILKESQKNSTEIMMVLDSETLTYSKTDKGMRVSSLAGMLDAVSPWTNLYKESIGEHTKELGIRYELVHEIKKDLKQIDPSGGNEP
jgi:hypothetical protein